jgi:hypothetical protein
MACSKPACFAANDHAAIKARATWVSTKRRSDSRQDAGPDATSAPGPSMRGCGQAAALNARRKATPFGVPTPVTSS